jgi:hypothetical protein
MKNRELAFLLQNVTAVLNLTKGLNINKDAIATHAANLALARKRLDGYTEQYKNQEYMKTLSPAEQQCLQKNAQALYGTHEELRKELEFLDMTKTTTFVSKALNELEHAFLLIEWLLEEIGKTGETILPHLTCIRAATFDKGKYKNQIDSLYSELEAISYDFYKDHVQPFQMIEKEMAPMLIPISDHLTVAACWLGKEKERLLTEALPELKVIKLPEETVPEIPKGVENEKNKFN